MADPIDFGKTLRRQAALGRAALKQQQEKSHTLICAEDIIMRSKDWIWEGHLLRGAQELLTGLPGLGKSQAQLHFIACLTAGKNWPDGAAAVPKANVIMMTAEDCLDQEVIPRLLAAGANLDRVHILKSIKQDDKNWQFLLGEDLDELEKAVNVVGDVGLIAIDPITAYMGGRLDSHKATEVRSQLGPLKDFAERMNISVSTITHPAKGAGQKAIDHFIGSQAFIAAGRIGHLCIEEVDAEGSKTGRILFAHVKHSPSVQKPTLSYRIVGGVVVGQDQATHESISSSRVEWGTGSVNISADEAVSAASGKGEKADPQTKCQRFIQEMLSDGPVRKKQVEQEGARRGFTEKQLRTAKERLGVHAEKRGFGSDGEWWWEIVPF